MNDESPLASRRRVLIKGVDPAWVMAKIGSYEELDRPGEQTFPVAVRGPHAGGWVQLDVDPRLPLYHFHNLGTWMAGMVGDEVLPDGVILQSSGPVAVDYWLVPREQGSVLHGRRADGSPYAYDLAGGIVRTERELQAPPTSARLALLNRGVPPDLVEDWDLLAVADRTELRPWLLDSGGSLLGRIIEGIFGRR